MVKRYLDYRSMWEVFIWRYVTGRPRAEVIAEFQEAGYTRRRAQQTYDVYKKRYTEYVDHANGNHRYIANQCKHWLPPWLKKKDAGSKLEPTKPTDKVTDWIAILN